jgi:branched-chain amino acid transport system ATP-binding protein
VGRCLAALGLGAALAVVLGVARTVAFDTGRTTSSFLALAAAAFGVGVLIAVLLGRVRANLGTPIGPLLALFALVSAGAWLALFNTGDPTAVTALVAVGLAASVPPLTLAGVDELTLRPDSSGLDAVGLPAAALAGGVALGAGTMYLKPDLVWSDVTAAAGLVALAGAVLRLRRPDPAPVAVPPAPPAGSQAVPDLALCLALAATLGVAAAPAVRVGAYLRVGWDAGIRYALLTQASAGVAALAGIVGLVWHRRSVRSPRSTGAQMRAPSRHHRDVGDVADMARLAVGTGGALVMVAISQTLPGTVAGTALAAGAALVGVADLAAIGCDAARRDRVGPVVAVTAIAALTWVLTWWAWPTLVDAVGSERAVFALCAVPALVLGVVAVIGLRPSESAPAATTPSVPLSTAPDTPLSTTPDAAPVDGPAATPVVTPPPFPPTSPIGRVRPHRGRRALLDARGVEFSYGPVQVLFGVDLSVESGEILALLGTNGVGKTTFLRTVAGLAQPSAGRIEYCGGDLAPFSASDRVLLGINHIAAGAAVAPDLTVEENLAMFGHALRPGDARDGARRAYEAFPRLAERRSQRAAALSGGERQMLALSKSLVLRPRLLIIDECTLGLAPPAIAALVPVIRRLHAEGASVLLVEQSIHLALELADRAVVMEKGRIVHEADAESLRADPALVEAMYLEGIAAALEHTEAGAQ